jgi:hypothetical protein
MPSANITCKEHGFCQHTSLWVCDQCAPKISGTQPTDVQQLKDAIALLRKCVQQPNYQDRFSDLHAEVVSFVQHASV